jgi:hypothetical protein
MVNVATLAYVLNYNVIKCIKKIYLRAELNSRWPITESARIQSTAAIGQHKGKTNKKQKINNNNNDDDDDDDHSI